MAWRHDRAIASQPDAKAGVRRGNCTGYALLLQEGDELRAFGDSRWRGARAPGRRTRIVGYTEAVLEPCGRHAPSAAIECARSAVVALNGGLTADDLARYRAEGAALREDEAVKLARANTP
jgi:hypothetical protein